MSLAMLKARLVERLEPAAWWSPDRTAARSDFDLNPGAARPTGALKPAAVLVPVVARPQGATVVMTRRADTLTSHTGQIAFPGGRLDADETAVQAALREASEEIALESTAVEVVGVGDPYATVTGFLITPVVGWLAEPPVTMAAPGEVAEVFEVPWDFLMEPANHRRDFYDREGEPRRWFWAMPYQERYIWGATAGVLRALQGRLYGDEAAPGATAGEDAA